MTTKISGTGFNSLTVDELILTTPLAEQYGGSGSTGVYKMEYASPKSASGTFVDFTGIPSWAKRITVMFNGVSTNGASGLILQVGSSTSILTSGYLGSGAFITSGPGASSFTTGFAVSGGGVATNTRSGTTILTKMVDNTIVSSSNGGFVETAGTYNGGGHIALSSSILTQIRITTVNGTDLFDAGTINVMWEGFV